MRPGHPPVCWVLCPSARRSNPSSSSRDQGRPRGQPQGTTPPPPPPGCSVVRGQGDQMASRCPAGVGGARETCVAAGSTLSRPQVCARRRPLRSAQVPVAGPAALRGSGLGFGNILWHRPAQLPFKPESTFLSFLQRSRKVEHWTDLRARLWPRKQRTSLPGIRNSKRKPSAVRVAPPRGSCVPHVCNNLQSGGTRTAREEERQ